MTDGVRDGLAVPRRPPAAQRVAAVGGPAVRIEQDSLRAAAALPDEDDCLLLGGELPGIEVAVSPVPGRAQHVDVEQLRESARDGIAAGQAAQVRAREAVLRVHPGLHLGRLLVLEPAVWIGNADAVQGLHRFGATRGRVLQRRGPRHRLHERRRRSGRSYWGRPRRRRGVSRLRRLDRVGGLCGGAAEKERDEQGIAQRSLNACGVGIAKADVTARAPSSRADNLPSRRVTPHSRRRSRRVFRI